MCVKIGILELIRSKFHLRKNSGSVKGDFSPSKHDFLVEKTSPASPPAFSFVRLNIQLDRSGPRSFYVIGEAG